MGSHGRPSDIILEDEGLNTFPEIKKEKNFNGTTVFLIWGTPVRKEEIKNAQTANITLRLQNYILLADMTLCREHPKSYKHIY